MAQRNNYFALTKAQQQLVLEQASIKLGLPKQAVEKDLWVSAILQLTFTLPYAPSLVFKGGTSLSKVHHIINRFSEDIDLAIDRAMFNLAGDLTKKQVKKLRKASSVFVRDELLGQLKDAVEHSPLNSLCRIEVQPDGEGDSTYPEPRSIFIYYTSVFDDKLAYIDPIVKVEAGARSLLEPTKDAVIHSLVEDALPTISTTVVEVQVRTALAEKTFLEKAFLLHELFSVSNDVPAKRRSRHMYDLYMMMQKGIDEKAVTNDELWNTIHHHRSTLTSMHGVDYTPDIRERIQIVPPEQSMDSWKADYEEMVGAMIYNNPPSFDAIISSIKKLEDEFRKR
jgi:hypothetical protein